MAKKKEVTVEEKLRALFDLQLIDSRVDEIKNVRGELPLEVEDLEDEVAGLNTRLNKLKGDLDQIDDNIKSKKNIMKSLLKSPFNSTLISVYGIYIYMYIYIYRSEGFAFTGVRRHSVWAARVYSGLDSRFEKTWGIVTKALSIE